MAGNERWAVRVIIDSIDEDEHEIRVGDHFDIIGSELALPPGGRFSWSALLAVLPVLSIAERDLNGDTWLARKPFLAAPDPARGLVLRLERIPVGAAIHHSPPPENVPFRE